MKEELTQEQIQSSILAAFDSVNLINNLLTTEKNEDNKNTVKRNFEHLEVMMSKDWFSEALSTEQKNDIDSSIENGKLFIS